MSQIKTIAVLAVSTVLISLPTLANEVTTPSLSSLGNFNEENSPEKYERQITCALEAAGAKSQKQRARVQYMSKSLGTLFAQMSPELKSNFIHHLLAQGAAETGNLENVAEQKSDHKSSSSKHKGRGLMQITHPDNYAKLAGCERLIKQKPYPAKIGHREVSEAPKIENSDVVKNPDQVVSEKDERGRTLLSLGALCYFLDTKERHPETFGKALKGTSPEDVAEVGVGVNKGPHAIGKTKEPLAPEKRQKAFNDMKDCF